MNRLFPILFLLSFGCTDPESDTGDVSQQPETDALFFETYDRPDYRDLPVQSGDMFELTTGFQGVDDGPRARHEQCR